jgi:hypothetical protein
MQQTSKAVHATLAAINEAWRGNQPSGMKEFLHSGITMVLPGFAQTVVGRDALLASFEEFCQNARVLEYRETEETIQVVNNCGVASFRFEMVYERPAYRARSTGRDLWVFENTGGKWLAVWRTMLELSEAKEPGKEATV